MKFNVQADSVSKEALILQERTLPEQKFKNEAFLPETVYSFY